MYLLDTNICIALLKGNPQASSEFQQKFSRCYLATIVLAELYKGVYCSNQVENNLRNLNQFVDLMSVINFEIKDAIEFGKIQSELRQIGKPTGEIDAIIAAIARSHDWILVTNNTRHFENIINLRLENWLAI
ncbi:type II toxin-antitoxin system VapC family toxin [[Phormidium] sp. ETS-05]|uniref:type II toxin-antitoxin system VapC family toxin n=1 Tax=[Phormidium] sp. ETS-05 TaxID=222819 RepID=UPI0018EF0875|nr:type II toxin-antitoxin system VapC family toxin [[Phormidium] sp. ETS-05]